jgi:hypothetical protein
MSPVLWCSLPLARGCRALRRIMPELSATAPPIPVWCYRVVASAAELGGYLRRRRACNNAVRVIMDVDPQAKPAEDAISRC